MAPEHQHTFPYRNTRDVPLCPCGKTVFEAYQEQEQQLAQARAQKQTLEGQFQRALDTLRWQQVWSEKARTLLETAAAGFPDDWEVSEFTAKVCTFLAEHLQEATHEPGS